MAIDTYLKLPTLLKQYREDAGLTQEELAETAGLSARGISDIERGVSHRPRSDTIKRLAKALDLQGTDLERFIAVAGGRIGLPPSNQIERELQAGQPEEKISLRGLWKGADITEEDIDEVRREMWGNFPRGDV